MALTFTSFVFDKNTPYNPGDTITLTVTYSSDDVVPDAAVASAVSVTLSDTAGSVTQTSDGSAAFPDFSVETPSGTPQPVNVSATDTRTPPGVWTVMSNSFAPGGPPFDGTAVLTSVA